MRLVPVRVSSLVAAAWLTSATLSATGVLAQTPAKAPGKSIYTCVDATGKRRTSDRPIPECVDREQRELNSDGSLRRTVPPTLTTDERAAADAQQQEQALSAANQREAVRRDRNLLMRFPNEAAHQKAREGALEDVRKSLKVSESRLELLQKERKPLVDESEFYVGKPLPTKLRQQLDANDAASDAQRALVLNQQAELVRINDLYDAELQRLRKLWGGATPGSMGVLPGPSAAASAPGQKPAL